MFQVDVTGSAEKAIKQLDMLRAGVPLAIAKSLTFAAQDGKKAIEADMRVVFDRPTPYTLRALRLMPATAAKLAARVWVKDEFGTGKGMPATKYLTPQIYGGSRPLKRFEQALQRSGMMPAGYFAVPAGGARLNRYGNISPGQITQILSDLRASPDPTQNRNARTRRRFFVGRPGNGPLGVWQKTGRDGVRPILIFVRSVHYTKRLKFFETAEKVARVRFPHHLNRQMEKLSGHRLH